MTLVSVLNIVSRCSKRVVGFFGACAVLNGLSILALYYVNKDQNGGETLVLSNSEDGSGYLFSGVENILQDFMMYPPVVLNETIQGNKVSWYSDTGVEESYALIGDSQFDNLVLIGHGGNDVYSVSDGNIDSSGLRLRRTYSRPGHVIKYACGEDRDFPELLVEDQEDYFSLVGEKNAGNAYFSAWKRVFE